MASCFKIELDNDVIWEDVDSYDILNGGVVLPYSFHRLQGNFFKVEKNKKGVVTLKYRVDAPLAFWRVMSSQIEDYYVTEDKRYTFWIPFDNTNVKL